MNRIEAAGELQPVDQEPPIEKIWEQLDYNTGFISALDFLLGELACQLHSAELAFHTFRPVMYLHASCTGNF